MRRSWFHHFWPVSSPLSRGLRVLNPIDLLSCCCGLAWGVLLGQQNPRSVATCEPRTSFVMIERDPLSCPIAELPEPLCLMAVTALQMAVCREWWWRSRPKCTVSAHASKVSESGQSQHCFPQFSWSLQIFSTIITVCIQPYNPGCPTNVTSCRSARRPESSRLSD